jgi:hypothetical protein
MTSKRNTSDKSGKCKCLRTNKIDRLRNKNAFKWTILKSQWTDPLQFAPELKDQWSRDIPVTENNTINATDGTRNDNGLD